MGAIIRFQTIGSMRHMQCYKNSCQYQVSSTLYKERKRINGLYHKITHVAFSETHAVLQEMLSVSRFFYLVHRNEKYTWALP